MTTPKFSAGSNAQDLTSQLSTLQQKAHSWRLSPNGQGVERAFKFNTFKAAWAFMDAVAAECKNAKHHPEWSNTYNVVFVRWTTHNPAGLSDKDLRMAGVCDEVAKRSDSLEVDEEVQPNGLSQTANQAASAADGCCEPSGTVNNPEAEKQFVEEIEREAGKQGSMATIGGQPS